MSLIPLNPQTLAQHAKGTQEVAVSTYLERAREWLATAVEQTGPEQIAMAKAQIATAAEATKQLGLSKEIQLDATEMVRRAEYALGKAIRKGQAEGTIATKAEAQSRAGLVRQLGPDNANLPPRKPVPTDYLPRKEWNNSNPDVQDIADGFSTDAAFDEAIETARAEGNLSRANVTRKSSCAKPAPRDSTERKHQEAELINAFAAIVRRSLTPANVATLSPKAKARLVSILNNALEILEGTNQ